MAVSHDRYFLDRIAEKIFAFEGNGIIRQYAGGYSDYLDKRLPPESAVNQRTRNAGDKKLTASDEAQRPRRFSFNEQREYEQIETVIAEVEGKLRGIRVQIDASGSDFELLQKLVTDQAELERELDKLLERWTYLNEQAEEMSKNQK